MKTSTTDTKRLQTAPLPTGLRLRSRSGFTLTEAAVSAALLALVAAGLFASGIAAWRMVTHNRITSEARFLALQKLDEVVGENYANLVNQSATSLLTQTNFVQGIQPVVRSIELIGHAADRSVTNLADAAYLEVHAIAIYAPMPDRVVTSIFSTLIPAIP